MKHMISFIVLKIIKNELQKVVDERLANIKSNGCKVDRIVVFIDDLDRLSPDKAVEILKLFLEIRGCVFILAVDYEIVTLGIEKKYGKQIARTKGKIFFDKIIQLPFKVPIEQYDIKNYINDMLISHGVKDDNELKSYYYLIQFSIDTNPRSIKRLFNSFSLINKVALRKNSFGSEQLIGKRLLFTILCMQTQYENVYTYFLSNLET